jgi:hypothetical protein
MPTFREKPKPEEQLASVVAMQWRGDNMAEVENFTRGEFDKELTPDGSGVQFILFHTPRGTKKVGIGDWIVRRDGVLDGMRASQFAEEFALAEEPGDDQVATVTKLAAVPEPGPEPDPAPVSDPLDPPLTPITAAGDEFTGQVTAPYPSWETEEYEHLIGPESVKRGTDVIAVTYTCSCGWVSPVASDDENLARIPAQDHVEAVSMASASLMRQQQTEDVAAAPVIPPKGPANQ